MNSFRLLNLLMQELYDEIQINFDVFLQHHFVHLILLIQVDNNYSQMLLYHYDDSFDKIFDLRNVDNDASARILN